MPRTPILLLPTSVALALALACTTAPSAPAPVEVPVEDDVDAAGVVEGHEKRGASPMTDPDDYAAVDPPAAAIARIAPTPLDAQLAPVTPVARPATPPNVVLVLGCTVRKDQLTPYGGHADATPFLAALAAQGAIFDDTLAAAPWTRVAATAILTGRHAVRIGMVEPGTRRNNKKLPDSITTLGEHFAARGYLTIGATANPNLNAEFGFAQGYEHYQLDLSKSWTHALSGDTLARAAAEAIAAERARGDERPFFLRLMMLDAHAPRHAKADAYRAFAEEGVPARVAQYRSHLHDMDAALRTLDELLAAQGFDASNTVFMFVADHGEGMNYPDHHGFGHGQYFGSSSVYVPWIVRGPGVAVGQRVLGPTSQLDVLPTLLGLVGPPVDDPDLDGRDWSAWVRGEHTVVDRDRVYSDTWFGGSSRAAVFTASYQCQEDFGSTARQKKKGKFVPGCYDRHADPLFTSLIEQPALLADLRTWRAAVTADLQGGRVDEVEVDGDLNKQLEALGYLEDEEGP